MSKSPSQEINDNAIARLITKTPQREALSIDKPRWKSKNIWRIPAKKWWIIAQIIPDISKKEKGCDNRSDIFEKWNSDFKLKSNKYIKKGKTKKRPAPLTLWRIDIIPAAGSL